jgi:hypothetical protein
VKDGLEDSGSNKIGRSRYAVHTRACTFLLDPEGLCLSIVSRTGMVPPEIRRCVGAQFVACLHPDLEGGLVGELVIGSAALFVNDDPETGRKMLLRSGTIVHVEERGRAEPAAHPGLSDDTLDLAGGPPLERPPSTGARGGDTVPPPPGYGGASRPEVEEGTVTLTLPLFRSEAQRLVPGRKED